MKNDKQETPMEWFIEQLEEKGDLRETPSIRNIQLNIDTSDYMELKQQAKEMEKVRMIGLLEWMDKINLETPMRLETDFDDIVQQYYNETYGEQKMDNEIKQDPIDWLNHALDALDKQLEKTPKTIDYKSTRQLIFAKANEMMYAQNKITENTSDGYHTFKELYEFRKAYNVALFNEWGSQIVEEKKLGGAIVKSIKYNVHKSWKHHDGELCFGGGWFIVVAVLPTGQISNHYKAEDWDLFKIPQAKKALFEFDGHTSEDVINRLLKL